MTAGNTGLTIFMKFSGAEAQRVEDERVLGERPEEVQIADGITKEIADRPIKEGFGIGNSNQASRYVFATSEDFKRLLNDPETAYPPRWYFPIPFRSLLAKGVADPLAAGSA